MKTLPCLILGVLKVLYKGMWDHTNKQDGSWDACHLVVFWGSGCYNKKKRQWIHPLPHWYLGKCISITIVDGVAIGWGSCAVSGDRACRGQAGHCRCWWGIIVDWVVIAVVAMWMFWCGCQASACVMGPKWFCWWLVDWVVAAVVVMWMWMFWHGCQASACVVGPKWLCGWCGCQALGCIVGLKGFIGGGRCSWLGGHCCGGDVDILACLSSFGMRGGA